MQTNVDLVHTPRFVGRLEKPSHGKGSTFYFGFRISKADQVSEKSAPADIEKKIIEPSRLGPVQSEDIEPSSRHQCVHMCELRLANDKLYALVFRFLSPCNIRE